jgi:hypothetical protein
MIKVLFIERNDGRREGCNTAAAERSRSADTAPSSARPRGASLDCATENSVQAPRAERPRSRLYATCRRRADTLTSNEMVRPSSRLNLRRLS